MSEHNTLSDDFTQGSIVGKLVKFMVPVLGALILQAMYGAVDLLVVGQFGTDAGISAVATGSNVINLVTFVITALVMGVTVLISRYLGEKRNERIGGVIGGTVCFFVIFTAVIMALLLFLAPVFASLLNAPEQAYDLTVQYVRICGVGIVFVVAYNVISGIFRGLGNSKLPLIFCPDRLYRKCYWRSAFRGSFSHECGGRRAGHDSGPGGQRGPVSVYHPQAEAAFYH